MTVTILRPKPKPTLFCSGCSAHLEFDFDDLEGAYFESDWTEIGPRGAGVRCPDCNTLTCYRQTPIAVLDRVWAKKEAAVAAKVTKEPSR